MGAELRFQIADIDSSHAAIIADATMLVICYLSSGMRGQREHPCVAGDSQLSSFVSLSDRGARLAMPSCGFAIRTRRDLILFELAGVRKVHGRFRY